VIELVELIHVQDEKMDWNILLRVEFDLELVGGVGVYQEVIVHEA
jgi:hypothetical protein